MNRFSAVEAVRPDYLTGKVLNLDLTFHWLSGPERVWFKRQTELGEDVVIVDARTGEESIVINPRCLDKPTYSQAVIISPDGRSAVMRKNDNLWLRDLSSTHEVQLTQDGSSIVGYGRVPPAIDTQQIARLEWGQEVPLHGTFWSPDSRFIVSLRQDSYAVSERLYVSEYLPPGGEFTRPHFRRVPLARDERLPENQLIIVDTETLTSHTANLENQAFNDFAEIYFLAGIVWWTEEGSRLVLLTANRGGSRYGLVSVDLRTGDTTTILEERAQFNVRLNPSDYARPNVYALSSGKEVVWYSERTGYGHLYLYSSSDGQLKRAITHGEWVVFDLLRVDEARRLVYFTGSARARDGNPYYRYLYRVGLDGGEPQLLTPEFADHKFENPGGLLRLVSSSVGATAGSSISPSGEYFVDSYSTIEQPPAYVLRKTSGELIAKLLISDASELYAAGWRPPEQVVAKAADGITELHGTITRPRNFDPHMKYPVIDSMYPGPQGSWSPRSFKDQLDGGGPIHHLQSFADAGFIVIAIDGRGTAHRSRAFREAFLGTEDVFGAADHVAAIKDLSVSRSYMDLERVGVRGQSFGGYGSLRAMLLYPEFFKVGVSATGPGEWLDFRSGINAERYFGVPTDSIDELSHYAILSNTRLASRLKGKLLLLYGGIDENVPLRCAFHLLDAFIAADKDVDLLIMPRSAHSAPREPYAIRRSIEYFLEHLAV